MAGVRREGEDPDLCGPPRTLQMGTNGRQYPVMPRASHDLLGSPLDTYILGNDRWISHWITLTPTLPVPQGSREWPWGSCGPRDRAMGAQGPFEALNENN